MSAGTLVLVHSPLTPPGVWARVAEALEARGRRAVVPAAAPMEHRPDPTWSDFVDGVARSLVDERDVVLVGHSGAGLLLPLVSSRGGPNVGSYVFVDAAVPALGSSTPLVPASFLPTLRAPAREGRLLPGRHLHMAVDPAATAEAILGLLANLG